MSLCCDGVAMNWFVQLKAALAAYYLPNRPRGIVGYLKGSDSPVVWRRMMESQSRHQMIKLGNTEPNDEDWTAAGVLQRGPSKEITIDKLAGFIILYGGFIRRPWGQIFITSPEGETIGFPGSLRSWRLNAPRR